LSLGVSIVIYAGIMLLFGERLAISSNYFVILPILIASLCYGLLGGILAGILGLPANLFFFYILGHPEFSPASKVIAEIFGIIVGLFFGYLADYFRKLDLEIKRRYLTERQLRKTLEEKEILLQEVHHRVKNNLNIVKSIVNLQKNRSENPEFIEASERLNQRIYAIAMIHEKLCQDYERTAPPLDLVLDGKIDLYNYLFALMESILAGLGAENLIFSFPPPRERIRTLADSASFLGLILNEVVTNSITHAFKDVTEPKLYINLEGRGNSFHLSVSDNGLGFNPDKREGLGLKIIRVLSEHLQGEINYDFNSGTSFRLNWKEKGE